MDDEASAGDKTGIVKTSINVIVSFTECLQSVRSAWRRKTREKPTLLVHNAYRSLLEFRVTMENVQNQGHGHDGHAYRPFQKSLRYACWAIIQSLAMADGNVTANLEAKTPQNIIASTSTFDGVYKVLR
jgi:hypothetical protein